MIPVACCRKITQCPTQVNDTDRLAIGLSSTRILDPRPLIGVTHLGQDLSASGGFIRLGRMSGSLWQRSGLVRRQCGGDPDPTGPQDTLHLTPTFCSSYTLESEPGYHALPPLPPVQSRWYGFRLVIDSQGGARQGYGSFAKGSFTLIGRISISYRRHR
jgi:hypothetical protein